MAKASKTVGSPSMTEEVQPQGLITREQAALAIPDYMLADDVDTGVEAMVQYVVPPRLKIVQKTSDNELQNEFPAGSVLLVPQKKLIARMHYDGPKSIEGETFLFTPLFFFTEFIEYNPIQMRGQLPTIRERSFDPSSALAARARDVKACKTPCPQNTTYTCHAVECLNFIIAIKEEGRSWLDSSICIMTFQRGEFRTGTALITLITGRRIRGKVAPLYGGVYAAKVPGSQRENEQGSWYGFDINNPDPEVHGPAFHLPEDFAAMKQLYTQYKELFDKKLIRPDYDDARPTDASATTSGDF